jgi:ethanolamine phosphate transferase 2 subunit G
MRSLSLSPSEITLASLFMQHVSYFAFGGTNAISSIDLSSAYNGVNSYNVLAVGILIFVGNWAGPIWWAVSCCMLLLERTSSAREALLRHFVLHTLFVSSSLMCVMMACTLLRTHLFIWTVFSPKYLYSMAWSLGQHLIVNMFLGCAIWVIGKDP